MIYFSALLYIVMVYIRPGEILDAVRLFPFVQVASYFSLPFLVFSLATDFRRIFALPQDRLIIAFWAIVAWSNIVGGWLEGGWLGFSRFMPCVFLYVLVRAAVRTKAQFRGLVGVFIVLVLIQAASGITQRATGYGLGGIEPIDIGGVVRIRGSGIFNDPNDLALTLLTAIPLLLKVAIGRKELFPRRLAALIVLVPIAFALYLTNSRGGVVGLAAAVLAYTYRRWSNVHATVVGAVVLTGLLAFAPSRMGQLEADEDSAQGRIHAWSEGLQMLKSAPIWGVGWDRFTEYHTQVAHNSFIHSLAELGLVGGVIFVGLFYWYFRSLVSGGWSQPPPEPRNPHDPDTAAEWYRWKNWTDALIASGVGMTVGVLFLSRQYDPVVYMLLALSAAYVSVSRESKAVVAVRPRLMDWMRIGTATASVVIAAYISARMFAVWF